MKESILKLVAGFIQGQNRRPLFSSLFLPESAPIVFNVLRLSLAVARRGHLTSATKSNGIIHSMPYWDERFEVNGKDFPRSDD